MRAGVARRTRRGFTKQQWIMGLTTNFLVASLIFATAAASPLKPDLDATKRLIDLTARQLEQTLRNDGAPGSGLTCDACKIVVGVLDVLFMENRTEDDIVEAATYFCIVLKTEDRNFAL